MKLFFVIVLLMQSLISSDAKDYIFFLHNRYLQVAGLEGVHPEFGKVEYTQILEKFIKSGFEVRSEIRPENTDAKEYAKKISAEIEALIKSGVPASRITVVGTSMGGYIAKYVSTELKNPKLKFVLIGCCNKDDEDIPLYGKILSIYEETDDIGLSCMAMRDKFGKKNLTINKEILLKTGLKHGFLYKALSEWINPAINWAKKK